MLVGKERDNFMILNWLDKYMVGHKGYIAGGCFKNILNQEKVKDLDIFFENTMDFEDAVLYFDRMTDDGEYSFYYQNDKVKAYIDKESSIRIELCKAVFGKPKDVLSQFDFTIAKFAYYKEEVEDDVDETGEKKTHIEYRIVCDENFFEHLHMKRLVTDDKILYPMSTFERMIRYIGYGYKPCKETKLKIASAINSLGKEQLSVSASLYDGMD